MLTNTIMGLFALGVLWVNTLLVAAAAGQRLRAITAKKARLVLRASVTPGTSGLFRGTLRSGDPSRGVARVTVEQLGRYGAGTARTIVWHDRTYGSACLGGSLVTEDGTELALPADTKAEVWPGPDALAKAARCSSRAAFDEAFAVARKAKGFVRTVEASFGDGESAWCFGEVRESAEGPLLAGRAGAPLLLSAIDPIAWCNRKIWFLGAVFIPGVIVGAALCSWVALWEPHFGTVSTIGGALCLLYFLLVLPAGTAARDAVREPHLRLLEGRWSEPPSARAAPTPAEPPEPSMQA